ncbi:hypothetical protein HOY82DRAFT_603002 [Tuber indicum]|nr:hypothetical protein HOY82DRAFT_603002 [Tuber indicum]
MPPTSRFPTETPLPQFNKRNHTQNQGGDDSGVKSPVGEIGLVIAALTLLVAMIPVFRCQRFRNWVSSFSISPFVKKDLGIALPSPLSTTVAAVEDLSDVPLAEDPMHGRVTTYNDYPNTHIVGIRSNTSPCSHNVIAREYGRAQQVGEPLEQRRAEPAITWPF